MDILIRRAVDEESDSLTAISFAAKRYWNYPEEYFDVWKDELTITPDYIKHNEVYAAKFGEKIVGFISMVEVKSDFKVGGLWLRKGLWLDHIFIHPVFMGKKVGSKLILFAKELCRKKNIKYLDILSDPNARGFYDRIGAQFIREVPSNIEGRTVSLYTLAI